MKRIKQEKQIHTKLLINPSKTEKARAKYYAAKKGLAYGFLPPKHTVAQFAVYLLGDTVSILSMEKNNLMGIKITNQHIAENFQSVFEALWKTVKR